MSINLNATYTKAGATFASGDEAYADKNRLYPAELNQAIADCYAQMLADDILLEPITLIWDPTTGTLTVNKLVSSKEAYDAAINFDVAEATNLAGLAGWVNVPNTTP